MRTNDQYLHSIYSITGICARSAKETYSTEAEQIEAFNSRMRGIIKLMLDAIDEEIDGWEDEVVEVETDSDIDTCDTCGKPITEKDEKEIQEFEEMTEEEKDEAARKYLEEHPDDEPDENQ